jgi:hypothetical protein
MQGSLGSDCRQNGGSGVGARGKKLGELRESIEFNMFPRRYPLDPHNLGFLDGRDNGRCCPGSKREPFKLLLRLCVEILPTGVGQGFQPSSHTLLRSGLRFRQSCHRRNPCLPRGVIQGIAKQTGKVDQTTVVTFVSNEICSEFRTCHYDMLEYVYLCREVSRTFTFSESPIASSP